MKGIARASLGLLLAAFLLLPAQSRAQVVLGASGGLSIASLTGDDIDDGDFDSSTGLLAGGFVGFSFTDRVGLTTGLYYAQKGAKGADADVDVNVDYLEIPVLLQVGLAGNETTGLSVFAGPSIAFELSCELEGSQGGMDVTLDCDAAELGGDAVETKSTTFGGIVGLGVQHHLSGGMTLVANGGVDLGLQSIDDGDPEEDVKTRMWFAQVGVAWTVGGGMDGM